MKITQELGFILIQHICDRHKKAELNARLFHFNFDLNYLSKL